MQKWLVAAGAFVVGAALGMGVFVMVLLVVAYASLRQAGGPGLLAGSVRHWMVLVAPLAGGAALSWLAVRRLNRIQR